IRVTTVDCSATDAAGNVATGQFTIEVRNTAPVVTVPGNLVVEATSPSGARVDYVTSARDAQDGSLTPVCNPPSGGTFSFGTITVTCRATDSLGVVTSASFTVTVRDTNAPALTV